MDGVRSQFDRPPANTFRPPASSSHEVEVGLFSFSATASTSDQATARYRRGVTYTRLTPEERHEKAVESGSRGGQHRASLLTAERRREIARQAAVARWSAKTPAAV